MLYMVRRVGEKYILNNAITGQNVHLPPGLGKIFELIIASCK